MPEFKVDVGYFKMIAEFYERKCPCWGGEHSCPCPPFVETRNCRCKAVLPINAPKAQKPRFKTYKIDFSILAEIINNSYKCPKQKEKVCFCEEFLETGKCEIGAFENP